MSSAIATMVLVAAQTNREFQNYLKFFYDDCSAIANMSKKSLLYAPGGFEDLSASIRLVSRT